ncbi:glycosyltransferase [Acinetobacter schindleri]|uniref:glycosyltransferase n=1 Tax=Acinetobacter schindleri TaxID=108981 RepID=UPI00097295F6|nr:glycosyltransferase [Acinetobacter schindleri]APX64131.1 glycosyltransferase family 1 protein [Acinetobacter schindleri]
MKTLYVGPYVEKIYTGGDSVNKRNLDLLREILKDNLLIYTIKDPSNTTFQKLKGYLGGVTSGIINDILSLINSEKIEYIFLSQSFFGKLCRAIKLRFPSVKVITFYHNIEKHYAKEFVKVSGLTHYPFYLLASYNEALTVRYSDFNFVLNERDALLMHSIYGVDSDFKLPVSYEDVFDEKKIKNTPNNPLKILFVGTAFFGNIPGIQFFVDNVMPNVDAELIIVGKGMENYKELLEKNSKIQVFGFVEDLSILYYESSVVIAPIFSGGGMKTKIAEALMYGKTVLGTKEAFEGYKRESGVTYECNSADEFVDCINKMNENKDISPFNLQARKIYQDNYDNNVLKIRLKKFFSEI